MEISSTLVDSGLGRGSAQIIFLRGLAVEIIKHLVFLERSIAEWSSGMAGRTLSLEESPPSLQGGGGRAFPALLCSQCLCFAGERELCGISRDEGAGKSCFLAPARVAYTTGTPHCTASPCLQPVTALAPHSSMILQAAL